MSELDSSPLDQALNKLAEIFFDPRFESAKLTHMADVPDDVAQTPSDAATWCNGLRAAWQNTEFQQLLAQIIDTGQQQMRQRGGDTDVLPDGLEDIDDAAAQQAVQRFSGLCKQLGADEAYAQWLCLALIGCYRLCSVNAAQAFQSEQWNEAAVRWMQAEAYFRAGRGSDLGAVLPELNRLTGGKLAALVGDRAVFGVAELAVYLPDISLFQQDQAQH